MLVYGMRYTTTLWTWGIISLLTLAACQKKNTDDTFITFASRAMQDVLPPMIKTLQAKVDKDGYAASVNFCAGFAGEHGKTKSSEWSEKAAQEIGAKTFRFRRISERNRNPQNTADARQTEILASWQKHGAKPTIYREGSQIFTMHPIKIPMPMCLGCHGDEKTLDKKAVMEIKRLYPNDRATGYKVGDLRGAFLTETTLRD